LSTFSSLLSLHSPPFGSAHYKTLKEMGCEGKGGKRKVATWGVEGEEERREGKRRRSVSIIDVLKCRHLSFFSWVDVL
jgi:hypothetical protein